MVNPIGNTQGAEQAGSTPPPNFTPPRGSAQQIQDVLGKLQDAYDALQKGDLPRAENDLQYIFSDQNGSLGYISKAINDIQSLAESLGCGDGREGTMPSISPGQTGYTESAIANIANDIQGWYSN